MTNDAHLPQGRILVCDDEPEIRAVLRRSLKLGGYDLVEASDGASLIDGVAQGGLDLVILDLMLGQEDGLELLRRMRETSDLPVIILTALGTPVDRIVGLELGADDYIAKPFEPRELVARVKTVLRRTDRKALPPQEIAFQGWTLKLQERRLLDACGVDVDLTTAQFDVLAALARNAGRVMSRDDLLSAARQRAGGPTDRSIDMHVSALRKRLEADPSKPSLIRTVHGAGYLFAAESKGA